MQENAATGYLNITMTVSIKEDINIKWRELQQFFMKVLLQP